MDRQAEEFADFEAFWRHFVQSHGDPRVRWCHVAGLACGVWGAVAARRRRRLMPLVLGGGALGALAVLSHPVFTGTWPENFGHPLWAARAFVRLCRRTAKGQALD